MKKISREMAHEKALSNVLASLRIERLTPTPAVITGMQSCLAGHHTTTALLQEVVDSHVKVSGR
jgi:hypothetical protein